MNIKMPFLLVLLLSIVKWCYSQRVNQQVFQPLGFTYVADNLILSQSVGEPMIETYTQPSIMLTQGFLQSELSSKVQSVSQNESNELAIGLFPNPASSYVTIKYSKQTYVDLEITDMSGRVYIVKSAVTTNDPIDITNWSSGMYLCKIIRKGYSTVTEKLVVM